MQDIDDECTTVIKIHRNFDEKFRDNKRPRLGDVQDDKSTGQFNHIFKIS